MALPQYMLYHQLMFLLTTLFVLYSFRHCREIIGSIPTTDWTCTVGLKKDKRRLNLCKHIKINLYSSRMYNNVFEIYSYLQPFIYTFWVEFMTAWQNSKGLPNFKITHANDTGCLVIFTTVSGIPEYKIYIYI